MALTDGLISYWELEETSGDVIDSHGDNDGTNNGADRGVTGKIGNAFDFDGSDDYVQIPHDDSLSFGDNDAFTISLWVNLDGLQDYSRFISKGGDQGGNYDIYYHLGNDRFTIRFGDDEIHSGVSSTSDKWYHLVSVYDGDGTAKIYIDGTEEGSGYASPPEDTGDVYIGDSGTGNDWVDGSIDEIVIWDRALSADEIEKIYHEGVGLTYDAYDADISGTATLDGNYVENAKVTLVDSDSDNIEGITTTDPVGYYYFSDLSDGTYHVAVEYDDGETKHNAKSKPYLKIGG